MYAPSPAFALVRTPLRCIDFVLALSWWCLDHALALLQRRLQQKGLLPLASASAFTIALPIVVRVNAGGLDFPRISHRHSQPWLL